MKNGLRSKSRWLVGVGLSGALMLTGCGVEDGTDAQGEPIVTEPTFEERQLELQLQHLLSAAASRGTLTEVVEGQRPGPFGLLHGPTGRDGLDSPLDQGWRSDLDGPTRRANLGSPLGGGQSGLSRADADRLEDRARYAVPLEAQRDDSDKPQR